MPSSTVIVFSPQHYFKQEKGGGFRMDDKGCVFTFLSGKTLTFKYADGSNLPTTLSTQKRRLASPHLQGRRI